MSNMAIEVAKLRIEVDALIEANLNRRMIIPGKKEILPVPESTGIYLGIERD
jgi:hypothetical protein